MRGLNESLEARALIPTRLMAAFGRVWDELKDELDAAIRHKLTDGVGSSRRDAYDLQVEVLTIVRDLQRRQELAGYVVGTGVTFPQVSNLGLGDQTGVTITGGGLMKSFDYSGLPAFITAGDPVDETKKSKKKK